MSYQSVADCLYKSEINLMISLTQFLHYDVFKVHVPFGAEQLIL